MNFLFIRELALPYESRRTSDIESFSFHAMFGRMRAHYFLVAAGLAIFTAPCLRGAANQSELHLDGRGLVGDASV